MQPQVRAMSAGQLVGAPGNLDLARYHAAKRRIKNQPLAWLGHLQNLAEGVDQMTVGNPALKPVRGAALE